MCISRLLNFICRLWKLRRCQRVSLPYYLQQPLKHNMSAPSVPITSRYGMPRLSSGIFLSTSIFQIGRILMLVFTLEQLTIGRSLINFVFRRETYLQSKWAHSQERLLPNISFRPHTVYFCVDLFKGRRTRFILILINAILYIHRLRKQFPINFFVNFNPLYLSWVEADALQRCRREPKTVNVIEIYLIWSYRSPYLCSCA